MKINEIIVRLEEWQKRLGYSTEQGELNDIIKDLREDVSCMKKWNFKLENEICPICKGNGSILESGDMHKSEGWIPCPLKNFQGHGYPTCGKDGIIHFSEYDIKNRPHNAETI